MYSARILDDDTAGPSGATIHENLKPAVEHHRMHEITPPPKSFLATDPQLTGWSMHQNNTKDDPERRSYHITDAPAFILIQIPLPWLHTLNRSRPWAIGTVVFEALPAIRITILTAVT